MSVRILTMTEARAIATAARLKAEQERQAATDKQALVDSALDGTSDLLEEIAALKASLVSLSNQLEDLQAAYRQLIPDLLTTPERIQAIKDIRYGYREALDHQAYYRILEAYLPDMLDDLETILIAKASLQQRES